MIKITTQIGQMEANRLTISEKTVWEILGIPYGTASGRFARAQMIDVYTKAPLNLGYGVRFPQRDIPPVMNRFLKNPMMRPEILTNQDKTSEDVLEK